MGISKEIGQTHTVITTDQPLYSKGKELVWQNQHTLENVIFEIGGHHICFNFLRVIGQHVEWSDLEDIWIETVVFGPNTVSAVLDGKAYYRTVRGHQLTYEALWRIKCSKVRSMTMNLPLRLFQSGRMSSRLQQG